MSESAMTQAARIATDASTLHSLVSQGKHAEALALLGAWPDKVAGLTTDLAMDATRAGMTQKRIAELLNVPPSYLRGLKAEARV